LAIGKYRWSDIVNPCRVTPGAVATRPPRIGESFESSRRDEGIHDTVIAIAINQTLALQIEHEMASQGISRSQMARRMETGASQLGRLPDPENDRAQLDTLVKAASAAGTRTLP
jgi:predicted XRE-type DNA-binding protein